MKIKQFFKTLLVFFTGNVMSKLIALFLLPLYTSQLLPEQMGNYDIVMSIINLVAPIAFLQIWDGMFRFAFDYKENDSKYKIVNNSIIVSFAGIIAYLLIFSSISLFFQIDYFVYVVIYGLLFAFQYVYSFSARVFMNNKLFVASGVVNTLVTALLNIIFMLVFNWGLESLYISQIIGTLLQIIIMEFGVKLFKHFKVKDFDKSLIVNMIKFSAPLCIATISYWLLSGFSKIIVYSELGLHANGLYAVSNRFSSMIAIVTTVFQYAWNEFAYLMVTDKDKKKNYSICVNLMLKCVAYGSIVICLLIKIVFPYFIDAQYYEAINIIPATIIGVAVNSAAGFVGTLFMAEKDTKNILTTTLIASFINIVLGFSLATVFGLNGVLTILAVSFFVLMILRLIRLNNKYKIKIDLSNLYLIIIVAIGVVCYYFINNVWLLALIGVITMLAFALSMLLNIKAIKGRNKEVSEELNQENQI